MNLALKSPAKINLFLKILNKREDGFHNIETLFLAIDLCDEMKFTDANEISLSCDGAVSIPKGEDNLILRAARLLAKSCSKSLGARIHITKQIPTGAGLGGGSSNAASTLLALNKIWGLGYARQKLMTLGASLGADVPFFVSGESAAIGRGKGERITGLNGIGDKVIVIIYPTVSISTAWAYKGATNILTQQKQNVNLENLYNRYRKGDIALSALCFNDFEEVVFTKYPKIRDIKQDLLSYGAENAIMTGSGSAVAGFFNDKMSATKALNKFGHYSSFLARPGCREVLTSE